MNDEPLKTGPTQVLVRSISISDTEDISDSRHSSLDKSGHNSVYKQGGEAAPAPDLVEKVCSRSGTACGWCLATPEPNQLKLCSGCFSVAFVALSARGRGGPPTADSARSRRGLPAGRGGSL